MANRKGTARADAAVVAGKTGSRAAGQAPRKHKKTALWKDIRRSIAYSKGRFISIMLLMMLGSFALVGLFVAGPDMRATGETYFNEYSLSDLTVMSDYGLDGEDVSTINKTQGAAAIEYGYFKDVTIDGSTKALRVESKPDKVSQLELVDGRMPQKKGEIAIDSHIGKDYPIGSTIKLDEKPSSLSDKNVLRDDEYTVVGYVHTPEIISIVNMGQSTAGTGSLKGCGVVVEDEFDSDVFMTARMTFKDTEGKNPYSNEYRDLAQAHKSEVEDLTANCPARRLADVKADAQSSIDDGQAQVDDAKQQLSDAKQKLDDAADQLADGEKQIADSKATLADAKGQLADGQSQLDSAWDQLEAGRAQLESGRADLDANWPKLVSANNLINQNQRPTTPR